MGAAVGSARRSGWARGSVVGVAAVALGGCAGAPVEDGDHTAASATTLAPPTSSGLTTGAPPAADTGGAPSAESGATAADASVPLRPHPTWRSPDFDGDGVANADDCAPFYRHAWPGSVEVCGDGVVNSCARRQAGWQAEVCTREIEPMYAIYIGGDAHKELAALGDLRGDGGFVLGLGLQGARGCEVVGVDEAGDPLFDCFDLGGLYMLDLAALAPSRGWVYPAEPETLGVVGIGGEVRGRTYGSSLEGVGDFDGDGFDDFILGNDQRNPGEVDEVWLFWGPSPTVSLSEGVQLIVGDDPVRCIGYDMERAGDLTGDGVDDLVVGDPCADQVWVMSGAEVRAATGPTLSPAARVLEASAEGVLFGMGVNGARDLTGDGVADLVASAPDADHPYAAPDADFVGVYEGPLMGDLDATEAAFTLRASLPLSAGHDHTLGYTLDVGDLNGDGHGDLVVGDPTWYDAGGDPCALATWIFYGPVSGERLETDADATVCRFAAHDVQAHTDFDGDGRDDLLAAAGKGPREEAFRTGEFAAGEAYLMYSPFSGVTLATTDADVIFSCEPVREDCFDFGSQVQAIPDQSGDGVPDVVVGNYNDEFWLFAVPLPIR